MKFGSRLDSSSSMFAKKGDVWVTEKDQIGDYHSEQEEGRVILLKNGKERFQRGRINIKPIGNPDMDRWTAATFKGTDSRLKPVLATSCQSSRDPSAVKRINFLYNLNRKVFK